MASHAKPPANTSFGKCTISPVSILTFSVYGHKNQQKTQIIPLLQDLRVIFSPSIR